MSEPLREDYGGYWSDADIRVMVDEIQRLREVERVAKKCVNRSRGRGWYPGLVDELADALGMPPRRILGANEKEEV